MRENIPALAIDEITFRERSRIFRAIVVAGLTVGVLDGLAAVTNAALRGGSPLRVFQYIASALLGRDSFSGGWATASLGLTLHFLIACVVAVIYCGASLRFPVLVRRAFICGTIYGIAVYFAMAYLIVPLTAASQGPFSFAQLVIGGLTHIFCVGLPIALLTRRFALRN